MGERKDQKWSPYAPELDLVEPEFDTVEPEVQVRVSGKALLRGDENRAGHKTALVFFHLQKMTSAEQNHTTQLRSTAITRFEIPKLTKLYDNPGQDLYISEYAVSS